MQHLSRLRFTLVGFAALLLIVVATSAPAQTPKPRVQLLTPRPFGYFIGDVFHHQLLIEMDASYQLQRASLPAPGKIKPWLELRSIDVQEEVEDGVRSYRIGLDYQVFYFPRAALALQMPPMQLVASGNGTTVTFKVPGWEFAISRMHEAAGVRVVDGEAYLRPPSLPPRINEAIHQRRLIYYGLGLLVLACVAVLMFGWLPVRKGRPFARGLRALRRLRHGSEDARARYRSGLRALHRAFDATAGWPVFPGRLEPFFEQHPAFEPLEPEIREFFDRSGEEFFNDPAPACDHAEGLTDLTKLCRRLSDREAQL